MKLTVLQENFVAGLATVSKAVSKRNTLPVLGNILLSTNKSQGRLTLRATDLSIGVACEIDAAIADEGAITLPARLLTDWVSSVTAEKVEMALNAKTLAMSLTCGRFASNIKGIAADEFPLLPAAAGEPGLTLPCAELAAAINQVVIATATETSRPALGGILFDADGEILTLVATDGFRLARRHLTLAVSPSAPLRAIIPAATCREIARLCKAAGEDATASLSIAAGANQLILSIVDDASEVRNVTVASSLIDAKFPDYTAIIPKEHKTRTTVDLAELQKALKNIGLFAADASDRAEIVIAEGTLTVSGRSAETGDGTGVLDAAVAGDGLTIYVNVQYLSEALAALGASQVVIESTRPDRPLVLKRVGSADLLYVIMPMQER